MSIKSLVYAWVMAMVLSVAAFAQTPTLPQVWVNNNEGNIAVSSPTYTVNFPASGTGGAWNCGAILYGPYTANNVASAQSAIIQVEACRTINNGIPNILLVFPNGSLFSGPNGLVIPQSSSTLSTGFVAIISSADSSLPVGQTVCAHDIGDNLSELTDIGLDNPDCAGDSLYYILGTTTTQLGQTVFSLDDLTTGWLVCSYEAGPPPVFCAGGSGIPSSPPAQSFNNASPSLDGGSMKLSLSGPSFTNAGWYQNYTVNNAANAMALDWWFYSGTISDTQALEDDQYKYLHAGDGGVTQNTRLYFGTQCVIGSVIDVWNSYSTGNWVSTGVSCPTITPNVWHHEIIKVHYNQGDTSAPGGYPKMYYDSIVIDGITYVSNFSSGTGGGALPAGWGEASGAMFQMDTNSACGSACTISENIDEAKGSQYQSNFTLANGNSETAASYDDVQYMWTAECTGTNCVAIQTCSPLGASSVSSPPACASTSIAPDHWLIEDGEFRMNVGNTGNNSIAGSIATNTETSPAQFATHIHWRKDWSHGDWTTLSAGKNAVTSGFAMSACNYCSVVDSQVSQVLRPGAEGHAISTEGIEYKFNHNWLEGQSSCIFAGGYSTVVGPSISGWVPFQDTEMRRNRCTFPYAWLGALTVPATNLYWSGQSIVRKNAEEFKEGERVLEDGDTFENVDNSGGQNGTVITRNIRSTSVVGQHGQNYQATINDVTETNNIYRNACQGWEIGARSSSTVGDGGGVSYPMRRYSLGNDLEYGITNTNPGCSGVGAFGDQLSSPGQSWQGTITGNGTTATFVANCSVDTGNCMGQVASVTVSGCTGSGTLTFGLPNIAGGTTATGTYNSSCVATITNPGSGYTSVPTVVPTTGTATATINTFPSGISTSTGFQVMNISVGDPVWIKMCTSVVGFNSPTHVISGHTLPSGVGPLATIGSAAWSGTFNLSGVTVGWASTVSGTDGIGYCTVSNIQGGPQSLSITHHTIVTNANQTIGNGNTLTTGPNFQISHLFRDSILLSSGASGAGWYNSVVGEGTPTEGFNYDFTSMSANHLVWPTRTATKYTEYGNNPFFPDSAGCIGLGCTPPLTMYFPATSYCTGAAATAACVGFNGAEYYNATSMLLAPSDYHDLKLTPGTSYAAGGTNEASDGADEGSNISAIDSAQTLNQYVCPINCGTGPYPDVAEELTVIVTGSGSVTDSVSIFCPSVCSAFYGLGTTVQLVAVANIGYSFSGWSGAGCSGTGECFITMNSPESVTATFSPSTSTYNGLTINGGSLNIHGGSINIVP